MGNRIASVIAAIVVIVMAGAFLALAYGVGATPGQDGVPATASPAYSFETGPEGTYHGEPELDTAEYGTDIPRCASDDWNSDHVARCYTERVTDGAVLIIDQADNVIATLK